MIYKGVPIFFCDMMPRGYLFFAKPSLVEPGEEKILLHEDTMPDFVAMVENFNPASKAEKEA